jgi:hypothetical protein
MRPECAKYLGFLSFNVVTYIWILERLERHAEHAYGVFRRPWRAAQGLGVFGITVSAILS